MDNPKRVAFCAFDISTTAAGVAVRSADGDEDFAAVDIRGATTWRDDPNFPGFDLAELPGMLDECMRILQGGGWDFDRSGEDTPGYVSVACRQHDMVVLDRDDKPLLPAISWQCNAAAAEVATLQQLGVEDSVGPLAPRFVLPKLMCVLNTAAGAGPSRDEIGTVFMTGDWLAAELTGVKSLSTSDALSNGLLDQQTRQRADAAIAAGGLDVAWFPKVVQSGQVVAPVLDQAPDGSAWSDIIGLLGNYNFVAGLGDNHASAVGCGMMSSSDESGDSALIVSAGTSGTINLACPIAAAPKASDILQFEFYDDSVMLLLMLADCGAWYSRFLAQFPETETSDLDALNEIAISGDISRIRRVVHCEQQHRELPSPARSGIAELTADTQFSIALELLLRVKQMIEATSGDAGAITKHVVLTGGLSQSLFFQQVFQTGVQMLISDCRVAISARTGPLRYKTTASGAIVNAELPISGSLGAIEGRQGRFAETECGQPDESRREQLVYLLRSYGI